jgi:hypothetical protein
MSSVHRKSATPCPSSHVVPLDKQKYICPIAVKKNRLELHGHLPITTIENAVDIIRGQKI